MRVITVDDEELILERMLELLSKDANYVSTENLAGILQWYISVFKIGDSDAL